MAVVLVRKTIGVDPTTYSAWFGWNANATAENVTHYTLWKSSASDMTGATQLNGNIAALKYNDSSASRSIYYALKAVNAHGASGYSDIVLYDGTEIYHKASNPYIHTCTGAFDPATPTVGELVKFDVVMGLSESKYANLRAAVKTADPNVVLLHYANLNNATDGDDLDTIIDAQATPDDYYLNAVTNCTQISGATTRTRLAGQRLYSYPSQSGNDNDAAGSRWLVDFSTASSRTLLIETYLRDGGYLPSNMDGWVIDNWGPAGDHGGYLSAGTMEWGGGSETAVVQLDTTNLTHETEQRKLMQLAVSTLCPTYYFTANSGTYSPSYASAVSHWRDFTAAGQSVGGQTLTYNTANTLLNSYGMTEEFLYSVTLIYSQFQQFILTNYEAWLANGSPTKWLHVCSWNPSAGVTEIPTDSNRMKITMLAVHLLYQYDASYFYYHRSNSTVSSNYIPASSALIGMPTGAKSSLDSRTYKREFTNGIAVVRFRTAAGDNYTDNSTYDLGGSYYELAADGTTSGPVSSKNLANMEGFIGLKTL